MLRLVAKPARLSDSGLGPGELVAGPSGFVRWLGRSRFEPGAGRADGPVEAFAQYAGRREFGESKSAIFPRISLSPARFLLPSISFPLS